MSDKHLGVKVSTEHYVDDYGRMVPYLVANGGGEEPGRGAVLLLHGCYREPVQQSSMIELTASALAAFASVSDDASPPAIFAAPLGHGNTRFEGVGAVDVHRVIDALHFRYRIDRDRISLLGISMGAYGALHLAVENVGRFVAVGLIGGYLNPDGWPLPLPPLRFPWERVYRQQHDLRKRLPNLLNTTLIARHAAGDLGIGGGVPVSESRALQRRAPLYGVKLNYSEWARSDHELMTAEERRDVVRRLTAFAGLSPATEVTWVGHWQRGSSCQLLDYVQSVDARLPRLRMTVSGETLNIATRNVGRFRLKAIAAVNVCVDGQLLPMQSYVDFARESDQWTLASQTGLQARHAGSISDVLCDRTAFVVPAIQSSHHEDLRAIAGAERRRYLETHSGLNCGAYRRGVLLDDLPLMTDRDFLGSGWRGNAILYGLQGQNEVINALVVDTCLRAANTVVAARRSEVLRARIPQAASQVYIANIATDIWALGGGFWLDYGRLPGYLMFNGREVFDWGEVTRDKLISGRSAQSSGTA